MVVMVVNYMTFLMEKEYESFDEYLRDLKAINENVDLWNMKHVNVEKMKTESTDITDCKWKARLEIRGEIKQHQDGTSVVALIFPVKGWKIKRMMTPGEANISLWSAEIDKMKWERYKLLEANKESNGEASFAREREKRIVELNDKIETCEKSIEDYYKNQRSHT